MIDKKGQLLLMAGIMICVTVMVVSISISHSVTLGQKQGENHDLTPMISIGLGYFFLNEKLCSFFILSLPLRYDRGL